MLGVQYFYRAPLTAGNNFLLTSLMFPGFLKMKSFCIHLNFLKTCDLFVLEGILNIFIAFVFCRCLTFYRTFPSYCSSCAKSSSYSSKTCWFLLFIQGMKLDASMNMLISIMVYSVLLLLRTSFLIKIWLFLDIAGTAYICEGTMESMVTQSVYF